MHGGRIAISTKVLWSTGITVTLTVYKGSDSFVFTTKKIVATQTETAKDFDKVSNIKEPNGKKS